MKINLTNKNNAEKNLKVIEMIDKGYFTPEIEDLKVGYECEINPSPKLNPYNWVKHTIGEIKTFLQDDFYRLIEIYLQTDSLESHIKVPFLTKEQIEAEGWKFKGKSVDLWWEKEGSFDIGNWTSYKIVIHYGMKGHVGNQDLRLYIYADDRGDEHRLFEGECKDINTFRYIIKLLGI